MAFLVREGLTNRTDDHLGVSAHDLQSGNLIWSYESESDVNYLKYAPVLSHNQLFVYTKVSGDLIIQVIDVNTGTLSWTLPYRYETKPFISDQYTYVLEDGDQSVSESTETDETEASEDEQALLSRFKLAVFDNKSGQERFSVVLKDSIFGDLDYPKMIQPYKQYVMLYYEDESQWFSLKSDKN